MKVLSIKEPWASLIINGYKDYEFRGYKTNYRGKILIHASNKVEYDMLNRFKKYNISYKPGYIIGEAYITDCILVDEQFINMLNKINPLVYSKSKHKRTYAWKLENIKMYDKPIFVKGKLGLWEYKETSVLYHLNKEPFDNIKKGTKTIEMRLFDEKRKLLKVGDIIEFENRENGDLIRTQIVNLHVFKNFKELYSNFDNIKLGYTKEQVKDYHDMDIYYSLEDQEKYGVVGIEIKLI